MQDDRQLGDMNSREAVEEIAHQIRSRQLNILSLVQLLRRIDSGEVETQSLTSALDIPTGLDSIQQSVHEISGLIDQLVAHIRDHETP